MDHEEVHRKNPLSAVTVPLSTARPQRPSEANATGRRVEKRRVGGPRRGDGESHRVEDHDAFVHVGQRGGHLRAASGNEAGEGVTLVGFGEAGYGSEADMGATLFDDRAKPWKVAGPCGERT